MYVEKTTAEERRIIDSSVEGLITQFDTCQRLLQDITETCFEFKNGEAVKCAIRPDLFYDRLWIIADLMFNTLLQYRLMMGEGEYGAVKTHLEGVDTARKAIAEEEEWKQKHWRKLETRIGK